MCIDVKIGEHQSTLHVAVNFLTAQAPEILQSECVFEKSNFYE